MTSRESLLKEKQRGNSHSGMVLVVDPSGICNFCYAKHFLLPISIWTKQSPRELAFKSFHDKFTSVMVALSHPAGLVLTT